MFREGFRKGAQRLSEFGRVARYSHRSPPIPKVHLTDKAKHKILEKWDKMETLSQVKKDPANLLRDQEISDAKAAVQKVLHDLSKEGCEDSSKLSKTVGDFLSGAIKAFRLSGLFGSKNKRDPSKMSDEEKLREAWLDRASKNDRAIKESMDDILLIAALLSDKHQIYQKEEGVVQPFSNALSVARGGRELRPHNDDVTPGTIYRERISAIALLCRQTNGSTLNYVIEAKDVYDQLPEKTRQILEEPIFYIDLGATQGSDPLDPAKVTSPFPIFSLSENQELQVCYDSQLASFMRVKESDKYSVDEVRRALKEIEKSLIHTHHEKLEKGGGFVMNEGESLVFNQESTMHGVGPRPSKLGEREINEGDPSREVVIVSFGRADGIDSKEQQH